MSEDINWTRARVDKIRRESERRKEWWRLHAKEFPPPRQSSQMERGPFAGLPVEDFTLPDLEGKTPSASPIFRGKTICCDFLGHLVHCLLGGNPDLIALRKKLGDHVAILGVALDGLARRTRSTRTGSKAKGATLTPNIPRAKELLGKVARAVKARGINYPVLSTQRPQWGDTSTGASYPPP